MGWEYEPGTVFEAEDLYCVDRLPMREVSERTGVPESTLWRWAANHGWKGKREELRQAQSAIRGNTIRLRAKLIEQCLQHGTENPMGVFAAAKMEDVAQAAQKLALEERKAAPKLEELRPINSPDEAAKALEEALTIKLSWMLQDPSELDLKAVKGVKDALQMASKMRSKGDQGEDRKAKGWSVETAEKVRRDILGIKT
jgi:hypothetical protein